MSSIEEQELRGYLLGSLSPERAADLEEQLRHDQDLGEQLKAVEVELYDQFVAGSLTVEERQRFESRVLNVDGGEQKLLFAQLFAKYRDSRRQEESFVLDRVPAPNTPIPAPSSLFAKFFRNPAFAVSLMIVVGLLAVLFVWTSRLRAPASHSARRVESALSRELTLTPGSLRSAGVIQHMQAPPKNVQVKIFLELAQSDFAKYKTQLFRANEALESQEELTTEARNAHYVVPVTVIGEILTPGEYQLKLSGVPASGSPTFIDNYTFRVMPQNPAEATESESRREQLAR